MLKALLFIYVHIHPGDDSTRVFDLPASRGELLPFCSSRPSSIRCEVPSGSSARDRGLSVAMSEPSESDEANEAGPAKHQKLQLALEMLQNYCVTW